MYKIATVGRCRDGELTSPAYRGEGPALPWPLRKTTTAIYQRESMELRSEIARARKACRNASRTA
jgi:hypothetical protein